MRSSVIRGLIWITLGFVTLWGLRLGVGYLEQPNGRATTVPSRADDDGFELTKRNYASTKVVRQGGGTGAGAAMDQKYERVADLRARTRGFDADEASLRRTAAEHGGVIQLEHKRGLAGARVLQLAVGVPPEQFDGFVTAARAIGVATHLTIDKQDRTNAWRELEAKRATLETTRASLAELKRVPGTIAERTALEDRLLDLEDQLRSLGVSLGDFDQVNELCTVKLTLLEETTTRITVGPTIPLWRRARVAFEWTVPIYLRLCGALLSGVLFALIAAVVAERVRPWGKLAARVETGREGPAEPAR